MIENSEYLQRKIKSASEIREIIGGIPRKKKVVMCHGTFDIVHPGHVRHLMHAKSKGDILVASLTCDQFISKANYRPFIPEKMRALNLAALEIVDYVVIDKNETPLEGISVIQPDLFAKGYEYVDGGVHPKTQKEIEALEKYGGEILFTPGDIVYSSSNLIRTKEPNLAYEKLATLMHEEKITFNDLRETLKKFNGLQVHVTGDTIVDTYTYCNLIGSGTKTPTPSVRKLNSKDYVGGAGVVAKHLQTAGAQVKFSTILGDDPMKDFVLEDLKKAGVECLAHIDKTRPTTNKNAYIADGYRLLKVDTLDNTPISDKLLDKLVKDIHDAKTDGYIFCDFRHGIFSKRSIPVLSEALPKDKFRVADSQVASRWGNILDFQGFDLITPNEREARFSLGDQDSVVRPLALDLYRKSGAKFMIMKLGEKGTLTYRRWTGEAEHDPRAFFS
jgi:rfaE bifunctional protein nucleotidyltransferase chain/domain